MEHVRVAYTFLKMHTPLKKSIRYLGLGLGFWALVLSLWAFPNLLLGLIFWNCIVIDMIVSSSIPGILDFGRYKIGCLQLPLFWQNHFSDECQKTEETPVLSNQDPRIHTLTPLANKCMQLGLARDRGVTCRRTLYPHLWAFCRKVRCNDSWKILVRANRLPTYLLVKDRVHT